MKKLLFLLAAAAYLCASVSCNDKPNTMTTETETNVDESKWQPADTCIINYNVDIHGPALVVKLYKVTSADVDFAASINSVYRHNTIILKNGSYAYAIDSNTEDMYHHLSFDTGFTPMFLVEGLFDSLRYGSYIITCWGNSKWGANYTPEYWGDSIFFYKDITFGRIHTKETVIVTDDRIDRAKRGVFEAL